VDRYVADVRTAKVLDAEFGKALLSAWNDECPSDLRLERFDSGEPIRRKMDVEGRDAAIALWARFQMPPMFSRVSKPRLTVDLSWRPDKGRDRRPYPWKCTCWLARDAGDAVAECLFRFLIRHFEPAFGSLSIESDIRAKHWFHFAEPDGGSVKAMRGLDVTNVLPGVYWRTYFGPGALAMLASGASPEDLLFAQRLGDGWVVPAYSSSSDIGSEAARRTEGAIREHLGEGRFFSRLSISSAADLALPPMPAG
jgi:hypothetical protein